VIIGAIFITYRETGTFGAFCGEKTITTGILQAVDITSPLVYFTQGHGETKSLQLEELFKSNGYEVKEIDLNTAEQNEVNKAKIIVICNPKKDFIGAKRDDLRETSETEKVKSFLNQLGSVMYFSSPEVGPLPELDDLLKEYGMAFEHGSLIVDETNSLNSSEYNLSANYYVAQNVGDELHASIRRLPSVTRTIVPYAKPINVLMTAYEMTVSPVLTSFDSSYRVFGNNIASEKGASNLLIVALRNYGIGEDEFDSALFLVCGSTQFLDYINDNSYSNEDIMLNAMRIMTNKKVATDIKWKEFDSQALNMTLEQQNTWKFLCILVLPCIVVILGIVVWVRRKNS